MGTPDFAVPALGAVAARCEVVAVVTQPDRPKGRGRASAASPVADAAARLGLEVLKPERANDEPTRERLRAFAADLFAVVAFGAILKPALLALPRLGSINLHGSMLPDYRGASPVQHALWDGRTATGVTTLWMDEGIDTGDMALQLWEPIAADDDAASLAERLARRGAPLLAESLVLAHAGRCPRRSQERSAGSYARKLEKRDGLLDWDLDAETLWNRQRAVTPWPGATVAHAGRRLILRRTRPEHRLPIEESPGTVLDVGADGLVVACGRGALRIESLVPEARGELAAAEWARGARVQRGDRLTTLKEDAS
jgi:methionyl-tRNA formyltransferase